MITLYCYHTHVVLTSIPNQFGIGVRQERFDFKPFDSELEKQRKVETAVAKCKVVGISINVIRGT
jgi:hypothetical protein